MIDDRQEMKELTIDDNWRRNNWNKVKILFRFIIYIYQFILLYQFILFILSLYYIYYFT